jgi:hypothetical protein
VSGEPVQKINEIRASKPAAPVDVWHSTDKNFKKFDPSLGIGGQMWFTSRQDLAEAGYDGAKGGRLVHAQIDLRNPAGREEYERYSLDELMGMGYDGIQLKDKGDEIVSVAFFPEQVRVVSNKKVSK